MNILFGERKIAQKNESPTAQIGSKTVYGVCYKIYKEKIIAKCYKKIKNQIFQTQPIWGKAWCSSYCSFGKKKTLTAQNRSNCAHFGKKFKKNVFSVTKESIKRSLRGIQQIPIFRFIDCGITFLPFFHPGAQDSWNTTNRW